jgi:hypothetical protein
MHSESSSSPATSRNYCEYFALLCGELPRPPDGTTQEARVARDKSAMEAVVALNPDNDFEARLAVRIVAMDAQAGDSLRLAALETDPEKVRQCRAQAVSMARQSDAALRLLLRLQATREKQEAAMHPAAMGRAGYWFHAPTIKTNELVGSGRPVPKLGLEGDFAWATELAGTRRGRCPAMPVR